MIPSFVGCPILSVGQPDMVPCVEHRCRWFQKIEGTNPQTGEPVEPWDCAVPMLFVAVLENAKQQRDTRKAVAEMHQTVKDGNTGLLTGLQRALKLRESTQRPAPAAVPTIERQD
jgi:hypothetical protein